MTSNRTTTVFKILTGPQWHQFVAEGVFAGSPDDLRDGFIHLSTREQVAGTLQRHFAGQDQLVLCEVDPGLLESELRWELSRNNQEFPHLYGVLPLQAVVATTPCAAARA